MSSLKPVWYSSHESELKKKYSCPKLSVNPASFECQKKAFSRCTLVNLAPTYQGIFCTAWSCLYDLQTKQTNKKNPRMKTLRWIKILQDFGVYHLNIVVSKCRHPASHCWVTSVRLFKFCSNSVLGGLWTT